MNQIEWLLGSLRGLRQTGPSRWMACCPAHDDGTPSLAIRETDDGRILLRCFAGCGFSEIVEALGMEEKDFFHADTRDRIPPSPTLGFPPRELVRLLLHESTVLQLALAQIIRWAESNPQAWDSIGLGKADRIRLEQACGAIESIRGEVGGRHGRKS